MAQRSPPVLPVYQLPGKKKGSSVGERCESDRSQWRLGVALCCTSSEVQPGLRMSERSHSDQRAYVNSVDPGSPF